MIAVLKHELSGYFHSLTAYIFSGFLLAFVGLGALLYNIQSAVANFEYVLGFVCLGLTVFIPILTMRVISEEKKQKTDQLLYSLPLRTSEIVLGKYLALLIVYLIPLCIVAIYPAVFAKFGEVYLPTSYGSLFAFFVMGAALVSVGIFISSLVDNQGFAAGITIPILLLNYYSVKLAEYVSSTALGSVLALGVIVLLLGLLIGYVTKHKNLAYLVISVCLLALGITYFVNASLFEGLLPKLMKQLSLFERFYGFINGVFDMTAIVYYVTVIIFFLFLTVQSLEKRRYN